MFKEVCELSEECKRMGQYVCFESPFDIRQCLECLMNGRDLMLWRWNSHWHASSVSTDDWEYVVKRVDAVNDCRRRDPEGRMESTLREWFPRDNAVSRSSWSRLSTIFGPDYPPYLVQELLLSILFSNPPRSRIHRIVSMDRRSSWSPALSLGNHSLKVEGEQS